MIEEPIESQCSTAFTGNAPVTALSNARLSPSPSQKPSVLLITVNYRSEDSTAKLINSLSKWKCFPDSNVIIIDNASGNDSTQTLRKMASRFPQVTLIESSINLGYFRAAGKALRHHLKNRQYPDWTIVCNNDITIDDESFVEKLSRHDPHKIGVVAPQILALPINVNQNPFIKKRPGLWTRFILRLFSSSYLLSICRDWLAEIVRFLKSKAANYGLQANKQYVADAVPIYAAHGSFFIFSRRFFETGGFIDENLFLYGEELSVAEICYSLKLPILFDPSLQVEHNEHTSTSKHMTRKLFEHHKRAIRYILSKYLSDWRFGIRIHQSGPYLRHMTVFFISTLKEMTYEHLDIQSLRR